MMKVILVGVPKGLDLYNARDENPPLIKPEEFEELKYFNSGV